MSETFKSQNFQREAELAWEHADEGIERQIYGYDNRVMMVKVKFEKGAVGSVHEHPHTQVSYVESGVFEITIADEPQVLRKGDGFYVPPNTLHGALCLEAGVLIDVFSPHRADFL
ncbi:cupin domain-containing protein [Pedobacter nyackensis]|uniref:cupin domain-containing protein n=1 Tax=Pedobacter nyackensis TaxID=475255 RepID=UPI00292F361B|nr:cupin domain-containing protein [Pedobacter nyackensis]